MTVATEPVLPVAILLLSTHLVETIKPAIPDGRVYWGLAGAPKDLPRVHIQPANAGKLLRHIGQPAGWQGEVAVRAYANSLEAAGALILMAASVLLTPASLEAPDGSLWQIGLKSVRPIIGLTGTVASVAGIIYQATIVAA